MCYSSLFRALPHWASFDSATGALTGIPTSSDMGTYGDIVITASDAIVSAALPAFSIEVRANAAPNITGSPIVQVPINTAYQFTPVASDADDDTLSFSITNKPAWASFSASAGTLSGTPSAADVGSSDNIVISVTDGVDTTSLPAFSIEVCDICNDVAPIISGIPATVVREGEQYSFTPSANDANGDTLTFSINQQPSWASFDSLTGTLSGTPNEAAVGTTTGIIISVTDGNSTASLPAFTLEVLALNDAPVIEGSPSLQVFQGDAYRFTPTASDADDDVLRFGISGQPAWTAFNVITGTLQGTPNGEDVGTYSDIVLSVTDGEAVTYLETFAIEVVARNTPPIISGSPRVAITQGQLYSFTPTASDADEDVLSFSITNKPTWASFSASTGTLSGTPSESDVGNSDDIVISVTDGTDVTSLAAFNIEVTSSNSPPVATDSNETLFEDSSAQVLLVASDADDDTLSFSIVSDVLNGQLSVIPGGFEYTPDADFIGSDSFRFVANDGTTDSNTATVSITVESVNDVPEAVDDDLTVTQDASGTYSLDVLANDVDVDIVTAGDTLSIQGAETELGTVTFANNLLQYSP